MRAVFAREPGGPDVLEVRDISDPAPASGEIVIDIAASAVNRPDLAQREGRYPPPPGASEVLGLECSGVVSAIGAEVTRWQVGDRVCALLNGGGYADKVAVAATQVLPVPEGLDLVDAAALPEVMCTVWSNVFMLAGLQRENLLLVHGGAGGIGTMAIQLGKALGARVATTVGSDEKATACRDLGADVVANYHDEDFVEVVRAYDERGADVVLDIIGAKYLERNLDILAVEGRLVVIGLQGGATAEINLNTLMAKRAAVLGTRLRPRPAEAKAAIVSSVEDNAWGLVADGTVKPIVHARFDLADVSAAHALVEESAHIGKVVLTT